MRRKALPHPTHPKHITTPAQHSNRVILADLEPATARQHLSSTALQHLTAKARTDHHSKGTDRADRDHISSKDRRCTIRHNSSRMGSRVIRHRERMTTEDVEEELAEGFARVY